MNRHELAIAVFERDRMCVAAKLDAAHVCQGRLTLEHVPIRGQNALQKKAPDEMWCCLALCLGAQNAYWGERHREDERDYLAKFYTQCICVHCNDVCFATIPGAICDSCADEPGAMACHAA